MTAGSDYVTEIHYYNDSLGKIDSSKINLKFCTVDSVRPVHTELWLYGATLLDGPLNIPANTIKTFHLATDVFSEDVSLIGLSPHAHLICKSWVVYMVVTSGDTIPLISIPNWNFDWQGCYLLTKVIKIPQGAQIFGTAVYDNTINNPNNPSNPPQDVSKGATRLDEMSQVRFWTMDYQPGDEEIILDSAFYGMPTGNVTKAPTDYLILFPNPSSKNITFAYSASKEEEVQYSVYNNLGERMSSGIGRSVEGNQSIELDCNSFPSGIYFFKLCNRASVYTKKFVIMK